MKDFHKHDCDIHSLCSTSHMPHKLLFAFCSLSSYVFDCLFCSERYLNILPGEGFLLSKNVLTKQVGLHVLPNFYAKDVKGKIVNKSCSMKWPCWNYIIQIW